MRGLSIPDDKETVPSDRNLGIRFLESRYRLKRNSGTATPERRFRIVRNTQPKYRVAEVMGYLKGKSSLMIFERHANLKYKYGNRHFWCRGYYVDTVGKNAKKIQEYIRNQLKEDLEYDQITLKEYIDPFTGEPVAKG